MWKHVVSKSIIMNKHFHESFIIAWKLKKHNIKTQMCLKIKMLLQKRCHLIVTCLFLLNWMVIISFKSDHHDQRLRGENPLKLLRNLKQDHTCGSYTTHKKRLLYYLRTSTTLAHLALGEMGGILIPSLQLIDWEIYKGGPKIS